MSARRSYGRPAPALLPASLLVALLATAARADDAELFLSDPDASTTRANVLFIIDTSGSMDTLVATQASFDSAQTFGGCYDSDALYFSTNGATTGLRQPQRPAQGRQPLRRLPPAARATWATTRTSCWPGTRPASAGTASRRTGRMARSSAKATAASTATGRRSETFAANGSEGPWSATDASEPAWTTQYTVYDGNWLNWRSNPPTVQKSRLDIVKEASTRSWPGSAT